MVIDDRGIRVEPPAVHRVADLEKLARLLRRAIRCATVDEFQKGLRTR